MLLRDERDDEWYQKARCASAASLSDACIVVFIGAVFMGLILYLVPGLAQLLFMSYMSVSYTVGNIPSTIKEGKEGK